MDFVCPKCKGLLTITSIGVKRCPLGHSYDRAKDGYYNLLLGAGGGTHGDNRDMVAARRAFLSGGFYLPLAERVAARVTELTPACGSVLDSGAGEGYYTDLAERALSARDGGSNLLAFDISKDAVKQAAKRNPRLSLAVASSYDMPLPDCSVDTVMNVFSPLAKDEVRRVLKVGGHFVIAFPGAKHLYGLKSAVYDTPYENRPEDTAIAGFSLVSEERIDYNLTLDRPEDIRSLFMMTPYAYRTSEEGRQRVLGLRELKTPVSFHLLSYRKLAYE